MVCCMIKIILRSMDIPYKLIDQNVHQLEPETTAKMNLEPIKSDNQQTSKSTKELTCQSETSK